MPQRRRLAQLWDLIAQHFNLDADLGQAHESAIKEAKSDSMKRALMTFGNPFGLALYDKQQREVTSSAASTPALNTNPSSRLTWGGDAISLDLRLA